MRRGVDLIAGAIVDPLGDAAWIAADIRGDPMARMACAVIRAGVEFRATAVHAPLALVGRDVGVGIEAELDEFPNGIAIRELSLTGLDDRPVNGCG